ncbi:26424_t:CDS:2, partial [Dentiscutata erythropus]
RHTNIIPRHNDRHAKSEPITPVLRQEPGSHLEPYDKKGEISCKSRATSYLAQKLVTQAKAKKNLPLAPNVDSKNLSPNNVLNKTTLTPEIKTSQTPNNQLHVNNNMILEKTVEPNTSKKKKVKPPLERKPKQEFSKENIKQNESTEKW